MGKIKRGWLQLCWSHGWSCGFLTLSFMKISPKSPLTRSRKIIKSIRIWCILPLIHEKIGLFYVKFSALSDGTIFESIQLRINLIFADFSYFPSGLLSDVLTNVIGSGIRSFKHARKSLLIELMLWRVTCLGIHFAIFIHSLWKCETVDGLKLTWNFKI